MRDLLRQAIETAVKRYPAVLQHLSADVWEVLKHYGPGDHPGTGTSQDVHGEDGTMGAGYQDAKNKMMRFSMANRVEQGAVLDKNGNVIEYFPGNTNSVSVDTAKLPEGSHFVHTHPRGDGTLSPDDIYCMGVSKCTSFEAVAMNGTTHRIYRTSSSKSPSIQAVRSYYLRTFKKYAQRHDDLELFNNAMYYAAKDTAEHYGYIYEVIK